MHKIVVIGFPHCGTTILRKLIGNSPEVFDIQIETTIMPDIKREETNSVMKFTTDNLDVVLPNYSDFKIITIIKNPLDVFGSIGRRFNGEEHQHHTINDWDSYASTFIKYRETPVDNMYTVRYEDLFDNSYEEVQNIYNFLGLEYSEDIILTKRDVLISSTCIDIPKEEPEGCENGNEHGNYRTWQTNQPFVNQIGKSREYLTDKQEEIIKGLETAKKLKYV